MYTLYALMPPFYYILITKLKIRKCTPGINRRSKNGKLVKKLETGTKNAYYAGYSTYTHTHSEPTLYCAANQSIWFCSNVFEVNFIVHELWIFIMRIRRTQEIDTWKWGEWELVLLLTLAPYIGMFWWVLSMHKNM